MSERPKGPEISKATRDQEIVEKMSIEQQKEFLNLYTEALSLYKVARSVDYADKVSPPGTFVQAEDMNEASVLLNRAADLYEDAERLMPFHDVAVFSQSIHTPAELRLAAEKAAKGEGVLGTSWNKVLPLARHIAESVAVSIKLECRRIRRNLQRKLVLSADEGWPHVEGRDW